MEQDTNWEWTTELNEDFETLKKEITEAPCLVHFDPKKDNYVTTDACKTGLAEEAEEGEVFRTVAFASTFLTDCEKKMQLMNWNC